MRKMTKCVAVVGYASLDYPVLVGSRIDNNRTTRIVARDPAAWPRIGGSPAYACAAMEKAGVRAVPVTWTGTDREGDHFVDLMAGAGLSTEGIARIDSGRSAISLLINQPDGSTACVFDPGFAGHEYLTQRQKELIADARCLCLTVAPEHVTAQAMSLCTQETMLFWIAKNDPAAFPDVLAGLLRHRATVIFCNRSERADMKLAEATEAIVVETRGADGVAVLKNGRCQTITAQSVGSADPTGAGDTFAGGFIASFIDNNDPIAAARHGMEAARELLIARARHSEVKP
jgi:ribokinase